MDYAKDILNIQDAKRIEHTFFDAITEHTRNTITTERERSAASNASWGSLGIREL